MKSNAQIAKIIILQFTKFVKYIYIKRRKINHRSKVEKEYNISRSKENC